MINSSQIIEQKADKPIEIASPFQQKQQINTPGSSLRESNNPDTNSKNNASSMQDEEETKHDSQSQSYDFEGQANNSRIMRLQKIKLPMEEDSSDQSEKDNPLKKVEFFKNFMENIKNYDEQDNFFKTYVPHNQQILDLQELHKSPNLRLKRYKTSIYYGEMLNGKRCGKGIMIFSNGRLYEGEWQNDVKFGRAFELFPNGSRYEGQYVNGKPEGIGTYIWYNGEIYDGQWVGGMKHGSGMWCGLRNESYQGEWKFGKTDGYGVHIWINGDRYEGQFKGCLKHGEGKELFANGDVYNGLYENGRPEGQGEYIWKNGSIYRGQFKNGLRHGKGIWKRSNVIIPCDKYDGEYENDKKCGLGLFTWATGNYYQGHYFDDLRHGYGEMVWTDGSYYKGQWEKGIQSGEGELYIPGEGIKKGIFINNVYKGNTLTQLGSHSYVPEADNLSQDGLQYLPSNQINARDDISVDFNDNQHSHASLPLQQDHYQKRFKKGSADINRLKSANYANKANSDLTDAQIITPINQANNQISHVSQAIQTSNPKLILEKQLVDNDKIKSKGLDQETQTISQEQDNKEGNSCNQQLYPCQPSQSSPIKNQATQPLNEEGVDNKNVAVVTKSYQDEGTQYITDNLNAIAQVTQTQLTSFDQSKKKDQQVLEQQKPDMNNNNDEKALQTSQLLPQPSQQKLQQSQKNEDQKQNVHQSQSQFQPDQEQQIRNSKELISHNDTFSTEGLKNQQIQNKKSNQQIIANNNTNQPDALTNKARAGSNLSNNSSSQQSQNGNNNKIVRKNHRLQSQDGEEVKDLLIQNQSDLKPKQLRQNDNTPKSIKNDSSQNQLDQSMQGVSTKVKPKKKRKKVPSALPKTNNNQDYDAEVSSTLSPNQKVQQAKTQTFGQQTTIEPYQKKSRSSYKGKNSVFPEIAANLRDDQSKNVPKFKAQYNPQHQIDEDSNEPSSLENTHNPNGLKQQQQQGHQQQQSYMTPKKNQQNKLSPIHERNIRSSRSSANNNIYNLPTQKLQEEMKDIYGQENGYTNYNLSVNNQHNLDLNDTTQQPFAAAEEHQRSYSDLGQRSQQTQTVISFTPLRAKLVQKEKRCISPDEVASAYYNSNKHKTSKSHHIDQNFPIEGQFRDQNEQMQQQQKKKNESFLPPIENNHNTQFTPQFIRRKPRNKRGGILLKKYELILWKNLKKTIPQNQIKLKDLSDPQTVEQIRSMIHPPVWKPAGYCQQFTPPKPQQQQILQPQPNPDQKRSISGGKRKQGYTHLELQHPQQYM